MADDIAWRPTDDQVRESNIHGFLEEYGYEQYDDLVPESISDLERVWGDIVEDTGIVWQEPYDDVIDVSDGVEFAHWFPGGELNAVETILDQWLASDPDRVIYEWADERGQTTSITYRTMAGLSGRLANALSDLGVGRGDVVAVTSPLHPRGFAACIAALRIGAVFTQIFPGYGTEAMRHRLADSEAMVVVAADGFRRNGSDIDLLEKVDGAIDGSTTVTDVVTWSHLSLDTTVTGAAQHDWDELVAGRDTAVDTVTVGTDHPAFVAYSSGTTGTPKGTIHTHASLLAMGNKEVRYHLDCGRDDTLAWVTDFGWIIVPIWLLAGAPALGTTAVLLEGSPTSPDDDRVWRTLERYEVTTFGISPSGARGLRELEAAPRDTHDLSSLRVLGSTGEPWDHEGWTWFFEAVGDGECPVINASGGTELCGGILSPTPATPLKPGTLFGPAPGVAADIYDEDGEPADEGYLVVELPIPGMTHSLTDGDDRYLAEYWERFTGVWNQNDWAERDEEGFWYITGRADDTMNVAGRRITAPAIEESIASHPWITDAAVIPIVDDVSGQLPVAFVTTSDSATTDEQRVEATVRDHVADTLGPPYRPDRVFVVPGLPRTQTGKVPRSVIKSVYEGDPVGDRSTLDGGDLLAAYPTRTGER